jgi:hypothetical protein
MVDRVAALQIENQKLREKLKACRRNVGKDNLELLTTRILLGKVVKQRDNLSDCLMKRHEKEGLFKRKFLTAPTE